MNIIDLHCDALFKLSEAKGKLSFAHSPELNTNIEKLKIGGVKVQCFEHGSPAIANRVCYCRPPLSLPLIPMVPNQS